MPPRVTDQTSPTAARFDGRDVCVFAGCNYLGLAHEPRVLAEASRLAGVRGLSTSASRETSGNAPEHAALEGAVVGFLHHAGMLEDGVLLPDGYTANLAALQGIAAGSAETRHAVCDERVHASLRDAARCAGLTVRTFAHRDARSLAATLAEIEGPAAVLTDGVFTADGGVAPLRGLLAAMRDDDVLVVDDCHGFCVLGHGGRGTWDAAGVRDGRVVLTTTLAKGLGGGGGVVAGPTDLVEAVRERSTAYICTTPVSPIVAGATLRALEVLGDEPERVSRLGENARRMLDGLAEIEGIARALEGHEGTPIFAFEAPAGVDGERAATALLDAGYFVPLMRYPGGPSASYFRASVSSEHTAEQIAGLCEALAGVFASAAVA